MAFIVSLPEYNTLKTPTGTAVTASNVHLPLLFKTVITQSSLALYAECPLRRGNERVVMGIEGVVMWI